MKNRLFFIATVCLLSPTAGAQVSISGPTCAAPGLGYQYVITTTDTGGHGISICITGGTYTATGGTCLNDSLVPAIYVTWDSSATAASISYTSAAGTATLNVNKATALQPGTIDTASLQQTIADSTSPAMITCPAATGGSCSPSYQYQWQQSADNLAWQPVQGATNQNMDVAVTITQNCFFRRMATETNSGTVGYSNSAAVYVNQPAQQ